MNSSIRLNDDYSERVQYNNPDYPIYIRRGLLSTYLEYRAPDHWHDDIEFLCVMSGKMKYNVNGDITEVEEGNGIFVNAGQMHFGFSDEEQECDFFCILLHPVLLSSLPDSRKKKPRKSQDLLIIKNMVRFVQNNYRKKISLTEIALSTGFGSASYYAETFRRKLGKSPKEYRQTETAGG